MNRISKLSTILAIILTFSACSTNKNIKRPIETTGKSVQSIETQTPVKIPTTKEIIDTLCSDDFQGRFTGSEGNKKSGEYVEKIFKDIGLEPYFDGSYYQTYYQGVTSVSGGDQRDIKIKTINNVVGFIKGKDNTKAVVISAHFDHIGYVDGKIIRGALDNASGVSALIKIAHTLKEKSKDKPFESDIIFCAFNGEETALQGSKAFVSQVNGIYFNMYNINIDCIGAKEGGKLTLKSTSNVSNKLYEALKSNFKENNINFVDKVAQGPSDHKSFENAGIPNAIITQENVKELIHKSRDIPDILDYEQIDKIANALCDFIIRNNEVIFMN